MPNDIRNEYHNIVTDALQRVQKASSHSLSLEDGILHVDGEPAIDTFSCEPLHLAGRLARADEGGKAHHELSGYAEQMIENAIKQAESERHTCPRRDAPGPWENGEGVDYWKKEPNGDRTCSFCGSLHFEDFMDVCREVIENENSSVRLSQSDKPYKVYVKRPDVKNATEGGIKFYKYHTPDMDEDEKSRKTALFRQALRVSKKKFGTYMQEMERTNWGQD